MPYLAGYVTPQDYGAAGNGVTDDTHAVQAANGAVSAAGGGILYFPGGTYNMSSAVTPANNVAYVGAGDTVSIIKQTSTTAGIFTGTDVQNVTITDLGLTGPGSGTGNGIAFTLASNTATLYVTMRNVTVKNFGGDGINIQIPIVSSFDRVVAQACGGYGINLYGVTTGAGSPGTSCSLRACYANGNTTGGYRLYKMSYTALAACAADNQPTGYLIDQGWNVALTGCGSEGNTTGIKINAGYGNSVFSQFIYANQGTGIWVTGTAHLTGLYQVTEVTPGGGATNFLKIDPGSFCTIVGQSNTTANALNGTVNILDDGGNGIDIAGYAYMQTTLEIGANLLLDSGYADITNSSASATALQTKAAGDTSERFVLTAGGTQQWGPGNAASDTTAGRAAPGVMYTSKNLLVGSAGSLGDNGVGEVQLANVTTAPSTNPTGGLVAYSSSGKLTTRNTAGLVETVSGSVQAQTSTATVANTTTTTALTSFTVPANDPQIGATYTIEGYGVYSTTGTPTLVLALSWAGTTLATIPAATLPSSVTNAAFRYKAIINFRSATSATAMLSVYVDTSTSADTTSTYVGVSSAPVTVVSSAASALVVNATWGTASASNTISLLGGTVVRVA